MAPMVWTGLMSPHSGAGSGFRIRSGLGLGFGMDTWSRSMGAFCRERIPTPGPVHINAQTGIIVGYSNTETLRSQHV
ncbi:unnamed protein product [Pleuronectes platessa]|uniref:Uncharacterized protein n=1 Tax=Pleuronectes platessa TaxID=8262 RepID=A0A9N7UGN3_PLEPL|nr:unnamed protein product [Pleuronectes platessa]